MRRFSVKAAASDPGLLAARQLVEDAVISDTATVLIPYGKEPQLIAASSLYLDSMIVREPIWFFPWGSEDNVRRGLEESLRYYAAVHPLIDSGLLAVLPLPTGESLYKAVVRGRRLSLDDWFRASVVAAGTREGYGRLHRLWPKDLIDWAAETIEYLPDRPWGSLAGEVLPEIAIAVALGLSPAPVAWPTPDWEHLFGAGGVRAKRLSEFQLPAFDGLSASELVHLRLSEPAFDEIRNGLGVVVNGGGTQRELLEVVDDVLLSAAEGASAVVRKSGYLSAALISVTTGVVGVGLDLATTGSVSASSLVGAAAAVPTVGLAAWLDARRSRRERDWSRILTEFRWDHAHKRRGISPPAP